MLGPLATLVLDRAVPQGDPAGHTSSPFMFLREGSRNVMRREWGRRKQEETSGPAAGTGSLRQHGGQPPPASQIQAKGPTASANTRRVKKGQLSRVGNGWRRRVSRKRVGESSSCTGSFHGGVGNTDRTETHGRGTPSPTRLAEISL